MNYIRHFILFAFSFFLARGVAAQEVVLSDNFEGGLGLWQTNTWQLSQRYSVSPAHSFTADSDTLPYPNNESRVAAMVTGANLTPYLGASLQFWARYEIEPVFDFCRIEASRDGIFWVPLGSLTGFNTTWQLLSCDLGAFAGLPNVRVRFDLISDSQTNYDGIYIDDLSIIGLPEDESGPLIIHRGPSGYQGTPFARQIYAEVWDASGVSQEHLLFRADGAPFAEAPLDSVVGESYYHTIPAQGAGTMVEYYFTATDASPGLYTTVSDTFGYLAGLMLIQDDGVSESIFEALPDHRAAVRFETHNAGYVTSALLRIYTDSVHLLDSIAAYVWADSEGLPGQILGGPFPAYPASTPSDPEAWTWVDLRSAMIQAPDTFHVGLQFAITGSVPNMALDYDVPARYQQSSMDIGAGWIAVPYGDFYIRCVVGNLTPPGIPPEGGQALPKNPDLAVFPNPTNGMLKLNLGANYHGGHVALVLYDVAGREMKRWRLAPPSGNQAIRLDLPDGLAGGLYFLEVGFEGGLRPERLKVVYLP